MLHTIENDQLTCSIASTGAEVRSLKEKSTGKEHIWQIDPSIWRGSSPVLFPAIAKIKGGHITYQGNSYPMPKHGIVRDNDSLRFEQHSDSKCSFTLCSSPDTLAQYPFKFEFTVSYELIDNQLILSYHIKNKDDVTLYFACGGHTAYAAPLTHGRQLQDYVIEFPMDQDLRASTLGASGLLSDEIRVIPLEHSVLHLSKTLFDRDALILKNIGVDWVRFRESGNKKGIKVHFENYPHLALWSQPGADYVCIEPWMGLPDAVDESQDITKKNSYKSLDPHQDYHIAIITEVESIE